ncbi:MAG: sugar phosphate isomerase/epimerase [bacterium]|nr:sugar phosphate isomerase/epimerase [bacterium]
MEHPKLAVQMYTVREFTQTAEGLAESLKKIRDIGYSAVQISAIGDISDADVKAMVDDAGLTVCSTHVRPTEAPWNDLEAVIEQHELWNCKHVAVGIMPEEYRDGQEDSFKRFAEEASKVGEKLHTAGFTFSYHNHSFELLRFGKQTGLDIIYDESDPKYLQAEIDTYWIQHGGGDSVEWIEKVSGRMPVVHFKDMAVKVDGKSACGEQLMAEVGEGNLYWPNILDACEDAEVEWYTVEQDVCQRDPFESLKISYDNLRAMGVE